MRLLRTLLLYLLVRLLLLAVDDALRLVSAVVTRPARTLTRRW